MSNRSSKKSLVETVFNDIKTNWTNEYNTNGIDYIKNMFLYIVGDDMYRFLKFFNKELKRRFDSIPGLTERIFYSQECNSHDKLRMKDIFFFDDCFKCSNVCDESYDDDYWFSLIVPPYRPDTYEEYFTSKTCEFESFSKCYHFSISRLYKFVLNDHDHYSSYNKKDDIISVFVTPDGGNLINFLKYISIAVSSYNDESGFLSQYVLIKLSNQLFIKIQYRSDYSDRNEGDFVIDSYNPGDGYTELRPLANSSARSVYIKSNKPLFNEQQCTFFHLMEKLLRSSSSSLLDKYFKDIRRVDITTQFIDQLYLKYAFIGNDVIMNLLDYLNSIKTTGIVKNDSEILGTPLRWIYPDDGINHRFYDRYWTHKTIKMIQESTFPKWLDLKNKSLLDNYINTYYYGQVLNESREEGNERMADISHDACPSLSALLDIANLKIDYYFKNLIKNYNH